MASLNWASKMGGGGGLRDDSICNWRLVWEGLVCHAYCFNPGLFGLIAIFVSLRKHQIKTCLTDTPKLWRFSNKRLKYWDCRITLLLWVLFEYSFTLESTLWVLFYSGEYSEYSLFTQSTLDLLYFYSWLTQNTTNRFWNLHHIPSYSYSMLGLINVCQFNFIEERYLCFNTSVFFRNAFCVQLSSTTSTLWCFDLVKVM